MATRRFTTYLVDVGVIAPVTPTSPPPGSPQQLCTELDHWLRNHQGMFGSRLKVYRNVMQRLIGFCCTTTATVEDLAAITPEAVFGFLDGYAGKAGWRLPYVRNILRFLFWSGRTPRNLSDAIPVAPAGRPHGLPRHLETSVVHKLLEAVRGDCAIDRRDHAMLLLMGPLGSAGAGSGRDTARRHRLGRGPDAGPRQRPAARPCADPCGRRRSHRHLAVQRAQGELAPPLRLRTPAVCAVHIVRARASRASQSVPAGRSRPARRSGADPCLAPRARHGAAGRGLLARRDRRCPAPPLRPVDNGLCEVRPRGVACAGPPVAGAGRGTMIPVAERVEQYLSSGASPSEPACRTVRFGNCGGSPPSRRTREPTM